MRQPTIKPQKVFCRYRHLDSVEWRIRTCGFPATVMMWISGSAPRGHIRPNADSGIIHMSVRRLKNTSPSDCYQNAFGSLLNQCMTSICCEEFWLCVSQDKSWDPPEKFPQIIQAYGLNCGKSKHQDQTLSFEFTKPRRPKLDSLHKVIEHVIVVTRILCIVLMLCTYNRLENCIAGTRAEELGMLRWLMPYG